MDDINDTSDKQSASTTVTVATVGREPMEMEIIDEERGHDSPATDDKSPPWRRRNQPIHQQYWSLKDMWENYHEIENPTHILWPALQATTIVLAAVLIACSLTYAAYQLSGSSVSVNRPWVGGVIEQGNKFDMMYGHNTEEVILGEHKDFETESP